MLGKGLIGIEVTASGGSMADKNGNKITIDANQVTGFINGTSKDLNNKTLGFGMSVLHEYRHTKHGGGYEHSFEIGLGMGKQKIDMPDIIGNTIRRELSTGTGTNYGQRTNYSPYIVGGYEWHAFSVETDNGLKTAEKTHNPGLIPTTNIIRGQSRPGL